MEMSGEYRIPAPRDRVWAALNDPEVLKACIPGCESLEMQSPTDMTARVIAKIGPVKAAFNGKVKLDNFNPPESYTISGEGQGGVAGFAKGGADVHLTPDGDGTILKYHAKAQIGGKLAQLGARLIDSTAKMMADQFFGKFTEVVGAAHAPPEAAAGAATEAGSPVAAAVSGTVEAVIEGAQSVASAVSRASASAAENLDRMAEPAAKRAGQLADHADRALKEASKSSGLPQWVWIVGAVVVLLIILKIIF